MGAVIVLGRRSIVDSTTAGIALASAVLLLQKRKIPEPIIEVLGAMVDAKTGRKAT